MTIKVAAIQMTSGADWQANCQTMQDTVQQAAQAGATIVVLPENFAFIGEHDRDKLPLAEEFGTGPIQQALATAAKDNQVTLVAGTMPLRSSEPGRVYASSLVFSATGECIARYDKIHLFDVEIGQGDKAAETYSESDTVVAGKQIVSVKLPSLTLGLSVCYDLRFPELYRELVSQGSDILIIPAAFTQTTGAAHWLTLCRARAIENQCFVIAANQTGAISATRRCFGHSVIFDPWGRELACLPEAPGFIVAECDLAMQAQIRESFPALTQRQLR